ncbi:hypothetical protein F2P56_035618 [Juglans regia]|nr:hypothetical protein F2P56_035618 [Juglans regia]
MARVWQIEGKAVFKEVGRNKFLVELKEKADKKRIMQGRPWSFDKNLICLQDCEGHESWKEMQFQHEPFWVQCHDPPFAGMNANTGFNLGKSMGEVLMVDTDDSGVCWGSFLRLRVMIDLTKPLARGRFLTLGNAKYWIPFKYERLPNFCYHCGKIKHVTGMCDKLDRGKASLEGFNQQYGAWLRTSPKSSFAEGSQSRRETGQGRISGHDQRKGDGEVQQEKDAPEGREESVMAGTEEVQEAGNQGGRYGSQSKADISCEERGISVLVEATLGKELPEEGDPPAQVTNVISQRDKAKTGKWKRKARARLVSNELQHNTCDMELDKPSKARKRKGQIDNGRLVGKRSKQTHVEEEEECVLKAMAAMQNCQSP